MTRLYTHDDCALHDMGAGHPERPARLRAVLDYLEASGLTSELDVEIASEITLERITSVHGSTYVESLEAASPASGLVQVDPDTAMGPASLRAARLAAGAVAAAVEAVLDGDTLRAFCAVRPPGHHAEATAPMGFCFYNSVAIAADLALTRDGIDKVAILDFDVHHGNGTVDIFMDRPEVLVCSSFQYPYYPYRLQDVQRPNIVNTPLPAGATGAFFREAIEADWPSAIEHHAPDLVLVSAGFDAHAADPLAGLKLDESDFRWITDLIVDLANAHAEGRVVSALEGGYDLDALARSAAAHVEVLHQRPAP